MKIRCDKGNKEYDIDDIHDNHCPICGSYVNVQHILLYYTIRDIHADVQNDGSQVKSQTDMLEEKIAKLNKELSILKAKQFERRKLKEEQRRKKMVDLEATQTIVIIATMFISIAALFISFGH